MALGLKQRFVPSYTTLGVGEAVRIRGQRHTSYTVTAAYDRDPVSGEWVYIHRLERAYSKRGWKLASGAVVRIENAYYRVRGHRGLGSESGTLEVVGFWENASLGLPDVDYKPGRPPNAEESALMEAATRREEHRAREAEFRVMEERERQEAICSVCGLPNYIVLDSPDGWFLKFTFDENKEKRWTCPGGVHQRLA